MFGELRVFMLVAKRFKWLLIAIAYIGAFATLRYYALFLFVPFLFLSLVAYAMDRDREAKDSDSFRGQRLFYRYGDELETLFFPLPVKSDWTEKDAEHFGRSLQAKLAERIRRHLPTDRVEVRADLRITDLETNEAKTFLRVMARSRYGSTLTHFVHYSAFGRTLTGHYFTYRRGIYGEWDVIRFAIESPFTIWFWGLPWLLNQHSIIEQLCRFRASSFDGIDFRTLYSMTKTILYSETEQLLEEEGLLTEEIKEAIHVHLQQNVQNINVSKSTDVRVGGLSQALKAS